MQNTQNTIQAGQIVTAVFAWREDEQPTAKNFFTGKVLEVVQRGQYAFYVRLEGLNKLMPMDRVKAV